MEEKKLSGEESLLLIQQMIRVARDEHQEKGDGWLIWGWLLFSATVASIVLSFLKLGSYIGWVWLGMLVIGLNCRRCAGSLADRFGRPAPTRLRPPSFCE